MFDAEQPVRKVGEAGVIGGVPGASITPGLPASGDGHRGDQCGQAGVIVPSGLTGQRALAYLFSMLLFYLVKHVLVIPLS